MTRTERLLRLARQRGDRAAELILRHPVQVDNPLTRDPKMSDLGPPTRSTFTAWEDDPDSAYEDRRLVASRFSLLNVLEYTEVTTTRYRRQRRERYDFWETPAARLPRWIDGDGDDATASVVVVDIPAVRLGRRETEYRPVPRAQWGSLDG